MFFAVGGSRRIRKTQGAAKVVFGLNAQETSSFSPLFRCCCRHHLLLGRGVDAARGAVSSRLVVLCCRGRRRRRRRYRGRRGRQYCHCLRHIAAATTTKTITITTTTTQAGKWHCGARSVSNLPTQRGFDTFFGFLKGACLQEGARLWL
jgi:hypothetical protein